MWLATGFRPFFLLAATFATLVVPLWVLSLAGIVPLQPALPGVLWHAHEMVWGFAAAVIAGFLLTAARNWTGLPTASGAGLAALCLLWLAGRALLLWGGGLPWGLVAGVDVAFLPVLALVIGRPIARAESWRNIGFPFLLVLLGCANLVVHASAARGAPEALPAIRDLALDALAWMLVLVGGRIIPLFTRNALPAAGVDPRGLVDDSAVAAVGLLVALDIAAIATPALRPATGVVAVAAGALNAARMWGWRSWATRAHPILWVLHVGYACVPAALLLRGVATLYPAVPLTVGTHVLTIGAIGTLTLGMMSRVALGHTGRPLVAPRPIAFAYVLVLLAMGTRVAASFTAAARGPTLWALSAGLFATAFGIYAVVYAPILLRPRVDGKPG